MRFPLLLYIALSECIHIIDPLTSSIPYLVPLAFQRECDRTDEFFHTDMDIENTEGDPLEFTLPPSFLTSTSFQRKPNVWTHEPFCLESTEAQNGYCVYTDIHFASGRGISVIATPFMARQISLVDIFGNKSGLNLKSTLEGFNRFTRKQMDNGDGYYIVANSSYSRGERMSSTTPTILMQHTGNSLLKEEDQSLLLRVAVRRSPVAAREIYMGMYATKGKDPWADRLEKNSFTAQVGGEQLAFVAAMPESALFNHDCRPNLGYHLDPQTLAHDLYVIRDIAPGEEITVSYIPPYDNYTVRASKLKQVWNFTCNCPLCTSPPSKINASDRRLRTIERLISELNLGYDERLPNVKNALRLVKLHEEEGLWGAISGAYMYVAMEYMQLGERGGALEWATKARNGLKLWSGEGHPYYLGMVKMVQELEEADRKDKKYGVKGKLEWGRKTEN